MPRYTICYEWCNTTKSYLQCWYVSRGVHCRKLDYILGDVVICKCCWNDMNLIILPFVVPHCQTAKCIKHSKWQRRNNTPTSVRSYMHDILYNDTINYHHYTMGDKRRPFTIESISANISGFTCFTFFFSRKIVSPHDGVCKTRYFRGYFQQWERIESVFV